MTTTRTDPRQSVPRVITPADLHRIAADFREDPRLTEVFRHLARLYSYEIDGTLASYDARQVATYRNELRGFEEQLALLVRDDQARENYRRILKRQLTLPTAPAPTPLPKTRPTGLPTPPPAPALAAPAPTPRPAPGQGDLEVPEYAYVGRPRDIDSRQVERTGATAVTPAAAATAQDQDQSAVTRHQVRRRNTVTTPARKSTANPVLSAALADMLAWIGRARLVTTPIIARRFYPPRPGQQPVSEQAVYKQLKKLEHLGLIERERTTRGRSTDATLLWLSRAGVRRLGLEYRLHFNYTPGVLRVGQRAQRHAKVVHHLACAQLLAEYESGSRPVPGELQGVLSAVELEQWAAASKHTDASAVRRWMAELGLVDICSEFGPYAVQYLDAAPGEQPNQFKIADLWIQTIEADGTLTNIAVEIELNVKPQAEYARIARAYLKAATGGTLTGVDFYLPSNRDHIRPLLEAAFAKHAENLPVQFSSFDPDPNSWPHHIRRTADRPT